VPQVKPGFTRAHPCERAGLSIRSGPGDIAPQGFVALTVGARRDGNTLSNDCLRWKLTAGDLWGHIFDRQPSSHRLTSTRAVQQTKHFKTDFCVPIPRRRQTSKMRETT